jgi:hypothetical protein
VQGFQEASVEQTLSAVAFAVITTTQTITGSSISEHYVTVPKDFPHIEVITKTGDIQDGYLFLDSFGPLTGTRYSYALIADNNGDPIYYKRSPDEMRYTDFKPHPGGLLSYISTVENQVTILDSSYTPMRTIHVEHLDAHEFLILPNGNVLLLVGETRIMDLSQIVPGGQPDARVLGEIIQELDPSNNVVFEWNSWDHFLITDTLRDLTLDEISFTHSNSLDVDGDGNIILSSRGLDEITKIDRKNGTGAILWRLGGKHNQFTLMGDTRFFFAQHDARIFANGHLTIFDDRHDPWRIPHGGEPSRALDYLLDEENKQVTLVRAYSDDIFSSATGNFQVLANGNWLIGWGGATYLATEVDTRGAVLLRLKYLINSYTATPEVIAYRVTRHPWSGCPAEPPVLIARYAGNQIALHFSWNGATSVTGYQLFGDTLPTPTNLITTTPRTRFEDVVLVSPPAAGVYYFRILPVTSDGCAPQFSNEIAALAADHFLYLPVVRNSDN